MLYHVPPQWLRVQTVLGQSLGYASSRMGTSERLYVWCVCVCVCVCVCACNRQWKYQMSSTENYGIIISCITDWQKTEASSLGLLIIEVHIQHLIKDGLTVNSNTGVPHLSVVSEVLPHITTVDTTTISRSHVIIWPLDLWVCTGC